MMDSIALFKILWAPISLIVGWLWFRINSNQNQLREHVHDTSNKYATKDEVRELLALHIDPIKEGVREIKDILKEEQAWRNKDRN